jgi:hypothetical protein
MTDPDAKRDSAPPPAPQPAKGDEREARLAAALRANLRRRKAKLDPKPKD